jgi:hypothetical protein
VIPKKNIAASVRQRLLNKARMDKRPFAEILQYYGMERFLYRLSQSKHAHTFVLKGALLLRTWGASMSRPTMDIDLLGRTSNEISAIKSQITDAIDVDLDDGLSFDTESIQVERITEEAEYEGVRVRFLGHLEAARIAMQIDIAFGDPVFPEPTLVEIPSILGSDRFSMLGYTRESAIAEKVDAMLRLGSINSRMKDFHDIWLLSRNFDYSGLVLSEALALTLETRGTDIPPNPAAFTTQFIHEKQDQWGAYLRRMSEKTTPSDFHSIMSQTQTFVQPVLRNIGASKTFNMTWIAPGPWQIT